MSTKRLSLSSILKTIETLVEDIYGSLENGVPDVDPSVWTDCGNRIGDILNRRLSREAREEDASRKRGLRMSNIGKPCSRQLWYDCNGYEGEKLEPNTRLKFLYGDILEEILLLLCTISGHRVEGRQDTQTIAGIEGHRDAVIDGVVTDTKSASTFSFRKFKDHSLAEDDPFGYIDQIQSYVHAGQDDPVVTDRTRGAFLVIDKTLGHICLDIHEKSPFPIEKMYEYKKEQVAKPRPPSRAYEDESEGKSGNRKLGMECSYCPFKKECWPGLRTFLYSSQNGPKPVFLTKVLREPKVPEVLPDEFESELLE